MGVEPGWCNCLDEDIFVVVSAESAVEGKVVDKEGRCDAHYGWEWWLVCVCKCSQIFLLFPFPISVVMETGDEEDHEQVDGMIVLILFYSVLLDSPQLSIHFSNDTASIIFSSITSVHPYICHVSIQLCIQFPSIWSSNPYPFVHSAFIQLPIFFAFILPLLSSIYPITHPVSPHSYTLLCICTFVTAFIHQSIYANIHSVFTYLFSHPPLSVVPLMLHPLIPAASFYFFSSHLCIHPSIQHPPIIWLFIY